MQSFVSAHVNCNVCHGCLQMSLYAHNNGQQSHRWFTLTRMFTCDLLYRIIVFLIQYQSKVFSHYEKNVSKLLTGSVNNPGDCLSNKGFIIIWITLLCKPLNWCFFLELNRLVNWQVLWLIDCLSHSSRKTPQNSLSSFFNIILCYSKLNFFWFWLVGRTSWIRHLELLGTFDGIV